MAARLNGNIAARLAERAAREPGRVAIVQIRSGRRRAITFGELAARVSRLAAAMAQSGIGPGRRVLLFVPMSIDLYAAMLATLHAGGTAVFVDAWAGRARLDAAVRAARPDLFVASPAGHALRLVSRAFREIARLWVASPRLFPLSRWEAETGMPAAELDGTADALITFTTGSTDTPKAAPRSHDLLWAQHRALAKHLRLAPEDVDMPTLPVFVLNNLALGITSVLPDFNPRRPSDIDPGRIVRQMESEGVTTSTGSPAFYDRLGDWCRTRSRSLDVRLWTGGAPVYPRLAREFDALTGGHAHIVYGSTEAEPIAGLSAGEMLRAMGRAGPDAGLCCGRPVPELEVRIIRPTDGPIELGKVDWDHWMISPGETGEIIVRGPHVIGAYLDAPEETRANKIRDGDSVWHRTGDAGHLDDDGVLWLMGRVAHRVVRDGITWWSAPAELRALAVTGVRHAAYFGVPDPILGQRAVLCVEAPPGTFGTAPELILPGRLAPIPVDHVHVLRHIPRDPRHASKTDLPALKRRVGAAG